MNVIRTIEKIPSVMNLRGIAKYELISFGLFVYSLMLTKLAREYVDF